MSINTNNWISCFRVDMGNDACREVAIFMVDNQKQGMLLQNPSERETLQETVFADITKYSDIVKNILINYGAQPGNSYLIQSISKYGDFQMKDNEISYDQEYSQQLLQMKNEIIGGVQEKISMVVNDIVIRVDAECPVLNNNNNNNDDYDYNSDNDSEGEYDSSNNNNNNSFDYEDV